MMDIEELNKSQIVLLTIFVAFVSSIATGIVTVSLMMQAPPSVSQTINRVVEKTIERVEKGVPGPIQIQTTVREVPVNQEDLIASVIAKSTGSLFQIYAAQESYEGTSTVPTFTAFGEPRGSGFMISGTGRAVTAGPVAYFDEGPIVALFKDGTGVQIKRLASDSTGEVTLLDVAVKGEYMQLSDSGAVLGKTAIAPSVGKDADSVALGTVTSVRSAASSTAALLQTTLTVKPGAVGSPVIDTKGSVVGVMVGERRAVHVDVIRKVLAELDALKKAQ